MADTLHYRLVVVDPAIQVSAPFTPGDATVDDGHFWVTSLRDSTQQPYISAPPTGEGERIDPLDGKVSDASYTVRVADVDTWGGSTLVAGDDFQSYTGTGGHASNASDYSGGPWVHEIIVNGVSSSGGNYNMLTLGPSGLSTDRTVSMAGGPNYDDDQVENYARRTFGTAEGLAADTQYTVRVDLKLVTSNKAGSQTTIDGPPIWRNILDWGVRATGASVVESHFVERPPTSGSYVNPYPDWQEVHLPVVSDASGNITVELAVFLTNNWIYWITWDNVEIWEGVVPGPGRVVTRQLTDADGLQRMLAREAYVEESEDVGTTWRTLCAGYVTRLAFPTGMEAEFSIGDTRRVERTQQAFALATGTFTASTPIIGGPILGGFGPIPDKGLPTFRVISNTAAVVPYKGVTKLQYQGGPLPPSYNERKDFLGRAFVGIKYDAINARARPFFVATSLYGRGWFPRLQVTIGDAGDGVPTPATTTPYSSGTVIQLPNPFNSFIQTGEEFIDHTGHIYIEWPDQANLPTVGNDYYISIVPRDVSANHPLHILAHPCDVVAGAYADLGVPYDSASLTTTKNALGADLIVALRITQPETAQTFIERLFGLFGFATRMGSDGEREFFVTRLRTSAAATTLTMADLRGPDGAMWDLDEGSVCNVVKVRAQRLLPLDFGGPDAAPYDKLEEQEILRVASYDSDGDGTPESSTYGERPVEFSLPGLIGYANVGEADLEQYTQALAQQIFVRHGRGAPVSTFGCVRNSTTAGLMVGEDVAITTDHRPTITLGNDPTSDRGGTQDFTITQRVDTPQGPRFRLLESGFTQSGTPSTSPILPTFTIAADATLPAAYASYEITNGAALTTAGAIVEVFVGFGASAPTDNGSLLATHIMGTLASYTFLAGPYNPGTVVWVRMRSRIANQNWSSFTAWDSATLTTIGGFPAVTTGTPAVSSCDFSWTNTDTTRYIQVNFQPGAVAAGPVIDLLAPGTTSYTVTGLAANTQYTITFAYTTGTTIGYGTAGVGTSSTFTTAVGALPTLSAPVAVRAYAGLTTSFGTIFDGRCGFVVVQPQLPADVVFEVAVETSVGSGTAGSYSQYAVVPAAGAGIPTTGATTAPNDGLLRFFRAYASAPGYTDSAYSAVLSINPWTGSSSTSNGNGSVLVGGPVPPSLSYTLDIATGVVDISALADLATTSVKIAAGSVNGSAPSSATVRAATADTSSPFTAASIATLAIGEYVIVGAYAYDAFGNESSLALLTVIRPATANAFGTVAVSGQSNVVADAGSDTLTLVAGTGVTITTNAGADSVTIAAGGIAESLIDAKGDLIVGSADNTAARLAVGTDGYVLTADAASANGVKWAAGGGSAALDDLSDVTVPTPADGDVLTWDTGTSAWINAQPISIASTNEQEWWEWAVNANLGSGWVSEDTPRSVTNDGTLADARDSDGNFRSLTTAATIGFGAGLYMGTKDTTRLDWSPQWCGVMKTASDITSQRLWLGITSSRSNLGGNDDPASTHLAMFRYSSGTDTNWQACTKDGTTLGTTDTGVAVTADTKYVLKIFCTPSSVAFYINGSLVATRTTNLPTSSQLLGEDAGVWTKVAAARAFKLSRYSVRHKQ